MCAKKNFRHVARKKSSNKSSKKERATRRGHRISIRTISITRGTKMKYLTILLLSLLFTTSVLADPIRDYQLDSGFITDSFVEQPNFELQFTNTGQSLWTNPTISFDYEVTNETRFPQLGALITSGSFTPIFVREFDTENRSVSFGLDPIDSGESAIVRFIMLNRTFLDHNINDLKFDTSIAGPSEVPAPASILLLLSGILAMLGIRGNQKREPI